MAAIYHELSEAENSTGRSKDGIAAHAVFQPRLRSFRAVLPVGPTIVSAKATAEMVAIELSIQGAVSWRPGLF